MRTTALGPGIGRVRTGPLQGGTETGVVPSENESIHSMYCVHLVTADGTRGEVAGV
jgi:hypothetical protein